MASQARWGCNATFTVAENGEVEWEDEGAAETPIELDAGGGRKEEWWRCPRRPVKDNPALFAELSHLWNMRDKGFLPYPGAYFEQPNYYVDAMRVIDVTVAEVERIEDLKHKMKQGGFGQGG